MKTAVSIVLFVVFITAQAFEADTLASGPTSTWNLEAAAKYLDAREAWWLKWPVSQRDQGTACVSCHTALPYALSRRTLRDALHEEAPSAPEQKMLEYVTKRVTMWSQVEPFYSDKQAGPKKTIESRGTESVLNALVLTNYDTDSASMSKTTKMALNAMWAQQLKSGPNEGAWEWLQFHNAPWEGRESQYLGATFGAMAVSLTAGDYRQSPEVRDNLSRLTNYLRQHYKEQPLLNRTLLLLVSARLPQLLTANEKAALKKELLSKQRDDGGWNLAQLGTWEGRHDGTPFDAHSDGYSTGVSALALEQNGMERTQAPLEKALAWLEHNQDPTEGRWIAWSLNKNRDLNSDVGRFMSDAATAYAVMALENRY